MWLRGRGTHLPTSLKSEWPIAPPPNGRSRVPILPFPTKAFSETISSATKTDGRSVDRQADGQRWILWCPGTFADPPLGPVLVKASNAAQLGPSRVQPRLAEAATNCGSLVTSNRLLRTRRGQHLTLTYTPSSDNIRAVSKGRS